MSELPPPTPPRKQRSDRGFLRGRRGPFEGSTFHWMSTFAVGEARYREFAIDAVAATQSMMSTLGAQSRYPDGMKGWAFSGQRLLVIPMAKPLAPYLIIKVERVR